LCGIINIGREYKRAHDLPNLQIGLRFFLEDLEARVSEAVLEKRELDRERFSNE